MRKHVIDTDIYIDLIRTGNFLSQLDTLYAEETPGIYFSSVVAAELLIGARSKSMLRVIHGLLNPFERVDRIVWPHHGHWKKSAGILGKLLKREPSLKERLPRLLNDCLIAVSARSIGAMVHTINGDDFSLIQSVYRFDLLVYPKQGSG